MASLGAALKTSKVGVLDISSNYFKGDELEGFCQHTPDMGPLYKLTFCGCDQYGSEGEPVTIDTTMTEADFSGKHLSATGAQILAAFMSTELFEARGSLVFLNLAKNKLGVEGAKHVAEVLPKW